MSSSSSVPAVALNTAIPVILVAACVLLSLLLIVSLLFIFLPNAFDSQGMIKMTRTLAATLTDNLGSALIRLEEHFWFYIPLGIIGIWRWAIWGFKRLCASFYRPVESRFASYHTTLSIVTPVYNEDPRTFRVALESWQANKPDELIAVIDQSDKDCIGVFKNFAKNKLWAKLIVTSKPGKRSALADGILEAKSKIVALVDSDTIWDYNIRERLLAPFSDPAVGGVTPRNHPLTRNSMWEKMIDVLWDMRNYYDLASQTAMGCALTCLTGRTSLYRREILLPRLDEFLNEILLGKRKESGEDKCLTRLVQEEGWKTYYQSTAVIYSAAASDFKTFVTQRIRWTRNSHNSDLVSLLDGWAWRHPYLAFYMIDRFISTFTLFLGPIFFGIAICLQQWFVAVAILLLWMVGRGIKILPHLRRHPEDVLLLPVFVGVNFLIALIKLYALITIREQKWIRASIKGGRQKDRKQTFEKIKNMILTIEIIGCLVMLVLYVLR